MFIRFNANPIGRRTNDCVIRAISVLTGKSWDLTYLEIAFWGYFFKDMPPVNDLWGSYLRFNGFVQIELPDWCPNCYTVKEFCKDFPIGRYIILFAGNGWGNNYGNGAGTVGADVQRGFDQSAVMNGITGINNALASAEVSFKTS